MSNGHPLTWSDGLCGSTVTYQRTIGTTPLYALLMNSLGEGENVTAALPDLYDHCVKAGDGREKRAYTTESIAFPQYTHSMLRIHPHKTLKRDRRFWRCICAFSILNFLPHRLPWYDSLCAANDQAIAQGAVLALYLVQR